jgi:hypothetical protein
MGVDPPGRENFVRKYFQGELISTGGGMMGRNLFILADEWDCGS